MSLPNMETQVKVVSEAAQNFVDSYYETLNKHKDLSQYYVTASPRLTGAGVTPDISVNGNLVTTPQSLQALLDSQGHHVHYDVGSFDAQPVNANFALGADNLSPSALKGDRVSFAVQVNGTVRYGKPGDDTTTEQAFTEAWLLVPNWEAQGPRAPRGLRRWLVVSQNFRAL